MSLAIVPFDPHTPNSDIIAKVWEYGSTDFQRRVPEPTKANIDATIRAITGYQPNYNEFVNALINKVGRTLARNASWSNTLAAYKLGMLEYGESIEEYQLGLIKAHVYDPRQAYGEKALFGRHGIDVQSSYHTINRENMYALTVEHPVLKRAFLSPDGLAQFTANLMAAPTTSDNWDEFLIMSRLFDYYERNGGFFKVHIDPLTSADNAKAFLELMREYAEILPYLSERYNAAHMPVFANKEDLTLFINPKAKAKIDVQALAMLFNVEYGDIPYKVSTLPEEYFFGVDAEIQAVLTTKDFFVCADTYFDTASQPNPAGRYENWFLHHDGIYSVSRFVPAIAFTTGAGTIVLSDSTPVTGIEDIVITDTTGATVSGDLIRGESYTISSSAITTPSDGENSAVRYKVTGLQSTLSYYSQYGPLHIAPNETATSITIQEFAEDDETITKTRTLNIVGTRIDLWPNPGVSPDVDNDGNYEVTPETLTKVAGKVTVPAQEGIRWTKTINDGVTFTDTGDIVTIPLHGASVGDIVKFGAITSTTGVTEGTEYFVKTVPSANTMTISATNGGATLALTTNGSAASATLNVADESQHTISGSTVFTAIPLTGYEIAAGADSTFSFTA